MHNGNDGILRKAQAAIEREAHLDTQAFPIRMEFRDGALLLAGEVPHIGAKKLALRAVAKVEGVGAVADRLRVAAGPTAGDGTTRDAVCRWLLRDIDFQNCGLAARIKGQLETLRVAGADASGNVEVAVTDGVVTLAGTVISLSHKRLAGALAWWAQGCRDVVNELAVVPPEEDSDDEIADALRLVLESDPSVHAAQIGIDSRDRVVTLAGVVPSAGERTRAEMDAWSVFAVDKVVNRLEVR
ncbi:MAG: BON domain-containing protein [Rhodocyclales bacterium]|nr:BON domain-containing protein [Rhodocyclales bacterium]